MSIDNQIEPPQSFMALYVTPGSSRPNAPQAEVLARYELCEDMACLLAEQAQTLADKERLSAQQVLRRCHEGLTQGASTLNGCEAVWVMHRLAELMEWPPLEFDGAP